MPKERESTDMKSGPLIYVCVLKYYLHYNTKTHKAVALINRE